MSFILLSSSFFAISVRSVSPTELFNSIYERKNLMFQLEKLILNYFLYQMNPVLLAVILCVTKLQSWLIAW